MASNIMSDKKHLVIIGGGFAGLSLAKRIDKDKWKVTLIDRHNYHSFPPLFYQVASAGLESSSVAFPFRRELRSRRYGSCGFLMGEVRKIDTIGKTVETCNATIRYDSLVIATGTTNNFFGIPELEKHVYTLKSVPQAIRCRNEVLDRLERAIHSQDHEVRRRLLTFLIVGGGPTGVEIAGALGEIKRYVIPREYPGIDRDEVKVILVEGGDRLLRTMSDYASRHALSYLKQLLVDVRLEKTMKTYDNDTVTFADGETIVTSTVIWTAGVTGETIKAEGTDIKPGPGNRWVVDGYNRVEGLADVYAIGDGCIHTDGRYPRGCPQLAQVAIQQGRTLAENLNNGTFFRKFSYRDKGSMATVGRNRAVVDLGRRHFGGWIAWMTWMAVHLLSLLGMRNRTVVFINWMWNYFTFSSGLRLIMRPSRYPLRSYWGEKNTKSS